MASVIAAPIPVPATDGKVHLAYELLLTNVLDQELTLTSVDVRAGDQTLLNLAGDRLTYWTRVVGKLHAHNETRAGTVRGRVARRRDDRGATSAQQSWCTRSGSRLAQPQPPLFPATMTETVAPVTVQTRKPVGHRAAACRPELGGRQQLLRHDAAPDGTESTQRAAVGR